MIQKYTDIYKMKQLKGQKAVVYGEEEQEVWKDLTRNCCYKSTSTI